MKNKTRIDVWLVENGLCLSRHKAQALIMAGQVYKDEVKIDKASFLVSSEDNILIREKDITYVSRGALKLEKAISCFNANINHKICMDIGAATGGFTDVLLKNGAEHVYAIDVGYGQFAWELRNHPKVTLWERCNARYLEKEQFDKIPTIAVMDVSFISIKLILPTLYNIMGKDGVCYVLIKPQFEAGKDFVGKNGVVKDPQVHINVIKDIAQFLETMSLEFKNLDYSPIKGPKGNIEYICEIAIKSSVQACINYDKISHIVNEAHDKLH